MSNLFKLIKKNFLLLLRSKASALIVILGPMLIIFLAGIAFDNTNLYRVSVGIYSESYNELGNSIVDSLGETFRVEKYLDEQECIRSISQGEINTCLVLPTGFAIGDNSNNEITFHIDQSKLNLVYAILESLSSTVSDRSRELSLNFTTVLIRTLDQTKEEAEGKRYVVTDLTTQNDLLNKKTSSVKSTIENWDLSINVDAEIDAVRKKRSNVAEALENLTDTTAELLADLIDLIDDVDRIVRTSNISGQDKSDALSVISDVESAADAVQSALDAGISEVEGSTGALNNTVSILNNKLNKTKSRFALIGKTKNRSIENLSQSIQLLDNSLIGISSIQDSINKISAGINAIEITDPTTIVQPIRTNIKPIIAPKTYLNYIFPIIIVLVVMFTAILLAPVLIFLEKKSSAAFRNYMTPTRTITYWMAIFLTSFILLGIQSLIIVGIAGSVFGAIFLSQIGSTLIVLGILISLFTFIGMIIGYVFNSEETAILASISVGTISIFLSNTILPIESIPGNLAKIVDYNPVLLGGELLRKTMVFSYTIPQIANELLIVGGYALILATISFLMYYLTKKHYISKTLRKFTQITPNEKNKKMR